LQNLEDYLTKDSHSTNLLNDGLEGGRNQEWKNVLEKICQKHVEYQDPYGKDMRNLRYVKRKLDIEKYKNPYILDPDDYKTEQELFDAIAHWWKTKKRKKESTAKHRMSIARRMSNHPVFPINWKKLTPEQVIAYLEYREYKENAGKHAILNEWKTINMFAKAFAVDTSLWGYVPPRPPKPKVKIIPMPDTAHKLMHTQYSKKRYLNALIGHIITHGFIIGWRPSEMVGQKLEDIYLDDGYIVITETKKYDQPRQVFLEKDILTNPLRKSLKNYIEHWRPKVANKKSKDYLYLAQRGGPFSEAYLRRYMAMYVKPHWKPFHLYVMRHWSAIARLIQTKVETNNFDIWDVKDRMGHEKVTTTEEYLRFAKRYYQNAPYDWIKAILKFHGMDQRNSLESIKGQNTSLSDGNIRRE